MDLNSEIKDSGEMTKEDDSNMTDESKPEKLSEEEKRLTESPSITRSKYLLNQSESDSSKVINRELKSILQLTKEAKLETNIVHKRKSLEAGKAEEMLIKQVPKVVVKPKVTENNPDLSLLKKNKDPFCWRCHKNVSEENEMIQGRACETCPRSFHFKCIKSSDSESWQCPECVSTLKAESLQTRSESMSSLGLDNLCTLLKFAVRRMMQVTDVSTSIINRAYYITPSVQLTTNKCEPFLTPVSEKEFPEYKSYIIYPIDLKKLEKNIQKNLYGSTNAFEAEAKWLLHNSIIFNSFQSKLTSVAKSILKICRQEISEIENCNNCYLNANTKDDWFVQICPTPHMPVWAKLKGFPHWPAKAMCVNNGMVDVRFFGAHDRAWVSYKDCYMYSLKNPNGSQVKRNDINECIKEVEVYIKNLEKKHGKFHYANYKTVFNVKKYNFESYLKPFPESFRGKDKSPKSETSVESSPKSSLSSTSDDKEMKSPMKMLSVENITCKSKKEVTLPPMEKVVTRSGDNNKTASEIENNNDKKGISENQPKTPAETRPKTSARQSAENRPRTPARQSAEKRPITPARHLAENRPRTPAQQLAENRPKTPAEELVENRPKTPAENRPRTPARHLVENRPRTPAQQLAENRPKTPAEQLVENQTKTPAEQLIENCPKTPGSKVVEKSPEKYEDKSNCHETTENSSPMKMKMSDQLIKKLNITDEDIELPKIIQEKKISVSNQPPKILNLHQLEVPPLAPLSKITPKKTYEDNDLLEVLYSETLDETVIDANISINQPEKNDTKEKPNDSKIENQPVKIKKYDRKISTGKDKSKHLQNTIVTVGTKKDAVLISPVIAKINDTKKRKHQKTEETGPVKIKKARKNSSDTEKISPKQKIKEKMDISIEKDPLAIDIPLNKSKTNSMSNKSKINSPPINSKINTPPDKLKISSPPNKQKINSSPNKSKINSTSNKSLKIDRALKSLSDVTILKVKKNEKELVPKLKKLKVNLSENDRFKAKTRLKFPPFGHQKARKSFPNTKVKDSSSKKADRKSSAAAKDGTPKNKLLNNVSSVQNLITQTLQSSNIVLVPQVVRTTGNATPTKNGQLITFVPRLPTSSNSKISVATIGTNNKVISMTGASPIVTPSSQTNKKSPTDNSNGTSTDVSKPSLKSLLLANTTVSSRIDSMAQKLANTFREMMEETIHDIANQTNNVEITVSSLRLEVESLKQKHAEEILEMKRNVNVIMQDIQKSVTQERENIVEDTRKQCRKEMFELLREAKRKNWCAYCSKEANFFCCWTTSYCNFTCQTKDWPKHMASCTQETTQFPQGIRVIQNKRSSINSS